MAAGQSVASASTSLPVFGIFDGRVISKSQWPRDKSMEWEMIVEASTAVYLSSQWNFLDNVAALTGHWRSYYHVWASSDEAIPWVSRSFY